MTITVDKLRLPYNQRYIMIQNGGCQNSHLIINVFFKRLSAEAGINALPEVIVIGKRIQR